MAVFLRKYNTAITAGTGQSIKIPLIKRGVVDFALSADWTPAAGDVKVSQDGGAAASIATLPAAVAMGNTAYWEFVFSSSEMSCKTLVVTVADSATKAVEDQSFIIETFGNASAMYQADLSAANLPANVTQFGGSNGTFSSGKPAVTLTNTDVSGNVASDVQTIKTQTVTCSGGVTVPAATLASTTNITSATGIDVTKINGSTTAAANASNFWVGVLADTGTAQAGASTTITLRSGANANDHFYEKAVVTIYGGTGIGQSRQITGYVGSTKVATVDTAWTTNPDNTSTYQILGRIQ